MLGFHLSVGEFGTILALSHNSVGCISLSPLFCGRSRATLGFHLSVGEQGSTWDLTHYSGGDHVAMFELSQYSVVNTTDLSHQLLEPWYVSYLTR